MSSKLFVVVGGAYGSEGKGAVTGRICADMAKRSYNVVNVRVGGPNAGHTVIGNCPPDCGAACGAGKHPWRLRQVPVAAVADRGATLVIAAGSEVDPDVLAAELRDLDAAGYGATERLKIDRSATVLVARHREEESHSDLRERLGSTAKGIGAARSSRIWREAQTWGEYVKNEGRPELEYLDVYDTAASLHHALTTSGHAVVVEGTQGYGLGLHTENYPFVTSGDCRAIDFLAQAGVSPWAMRYPDEDLKVVICMRPYPIRVAGNSGGLLGETTWEALGLPVEHTTVTQKVRRVGEWDPELGRAALAANGGARQGVVWVALTMVDSVEPEIAGNNWGQTGWFQRSAPVSTSPLLESLGLDSRCLGYVGTGPDTAIVNERMYY